MANGEATLATGTLIAGYRVEGVLGRGSWGVVYQATQLSLNRAVAVKVLSPEACQDDEFIERFRRESLLQGSLDHPHIVPVHEAGVSEHGPFIAMRMVPGPDLKDLILVGTLDPERTLRILFPVADALDVAHEAGLTHRDVKPHNILIGARDHAFLADFGSIRAAELAPLTGIGQFIGTIDYAAPEQIQGEAPQAGTDVYALTCVLFECLTGSVPFQLPTDAAVLYAHIARPAPLATERCADLPGEIDEVIARGMAKDPADRYPTATETIRSAARALGAPDHPVASLGDPEQSPF
jgi:serine/threonine-protein kinase